MFSDLTTRPLRPSPCDLPFAFLDQDALRNLANITAINLIENGDRTARENWQSRQLANLIGHAHSRSDFWRQRLSSDVTKRGIMEDLPMQSRDDVDGQVSLEEVFDGNGWQCADCRLFLHRINRHAIKVYVSVQRTGTTL